MNLSFFIASLLLGLLAPIVFLEFMKPVLNKVLRMLCDADGGAEFWLRSACLLAVCGTELLILLFGNFSVHATPIDVLRRTLLLVLSGLFFSIAFIARNVWDQLRTYLARQHTAANAATAPPEAISPA